MNEIHRWNSGRDHQKLKLFIFTVPENVCLHFIYIPFAYLERNAVIIKCFNNLAFWYHQLIYCTCSSLKEERSKIQLSRLPLLELSVHCLFKWIQLIEWSIYLNMNSRLHLSNKLKEGGKFLWIRLWNLCFISMKEPIFSKVAGCKPVTSLNWTPS